ncbi:GNAT family N-acetyltransferase [Vibrio toranzoniae]|jgi:L-amino acid N-acyltransferase YncA|uniref:Histone acetyltransferase n=1 Tax=Vibrio toranzoniae TaxID=1194427 RepID=A0A109D9N7_9VIBR|nr:GNAT family N-acetyltransferase [Vibrio toranzoniae]KWU01454.1 histone acetyltransferase [Vibrio toranzoniae]NAZ47804.1 GNAT family N-acetyltransferase [Vibrio toranzoniae]SBS39588.1 Putative phosphinothricin acetyltransferase YwnH [Vibrio toranzoniae]
MSLTVREVTVDDARGIIDVLNPIIIEARYTILDQTFSIDEERVFIESFPERGVFCVAVNEQNTQVLGFQNVEPFASYTKAFDHVGIIGTYVDANCRGQGVANQLFEYTIEAAKTKGYEKLFAYVRADNKRALTVYIKQGFEIVGTAKKHAKIGDQYFDEILIEKFL